MSFWRLILTCLVGNRDANDHRLQEGAGTPDFGDTIDAGAALDLGMVNRVVPLAELREASLRYAKRLSLILPEALFATKRAVNRGADAAGFRTALYAGLDVVWPLYATKTEFGTKFRDIVSAEGVPAAVKWRAAQFKE